MTIRPFRFAVVGCGMLAQQTHLRTIADSPRMALEICCDVSATTLGACLERFKPRRTASDFRAAVHDPAVDVIVLATTEALRLPVIEAAAQAGKPIYVEKPIAPTLDELRKIQRVVNAAKVPFCAGHNRRSSPAMLDAHRIFRAHMTAPKPCPWRFDREGPDKRPRLPDDGVAAMSVRINDDWWSWKGWVFDPEQTQFGPMLFEMTHFTDLCNFFLAAEPVEVVAISPGQLNHGVVIRYKTGEVATILMGANGTFGYPKELYEVMGNGGMVVIDHMVEVRTAGIEAAPARKFYALKGDRDGEVHDPAGGIHEWLAKKRHACGQVAATGDPMRQFTAEPDKGHAQALERFLDEIEGKGPVVCGIDDAAMATRVAFAAIKSAQERRFVALDEV